MQRASCVVNGELDWSPAIHLYSRGLVGWAMDSRMKTEVVSSALKQANGRTEAMEGLIIHSDCGVQYASNEYQNLFKKYGFI